MGDNEINRLCAKALDLIIKVPRPGDPSPDHENSLRVVFKGRDAMKELVPGKKERKEKAPAKEKQKAKLDMWWRVENHLYGNVYDHPTIPDGHFVITSDILWIDRLTKIAETRNTIYILLTEAK